MTLTPKSEAHSALEPPVDRLELGSKAPRLYHYTSLSGLLGILSSKVLWATDIGFLNDREEFKHAIKLVIGLLEQRLTNATDIDREPLEALRATLYEEMVFPGYIISFTENGDLLSQWRGYSPEGGASIGFNVAALREAAALSGFRLLKCIYDGETKTAIANEVLDTYLAEHRSFKDTDQREHFEARWFRFKFFQLAACFKDDAFSEENEWRLISEIGVSQDDNVQFRATSRLLVPYRELPLAVAGTQHPSLCVDRIVLAPGSQHELISTALSRLFTDKKLLTVSFAPSNAPYRSL
ncbi:DUF2971 domain-containing protein [Rhizobium sp.]|uniref:DUF2971 domain-containing protein n=1 Tax=Rhizobium sp. TaxID=391 RepID=UPI002EF93C38